MSPAKLNNRLTPNHEQQPHDYKQQQQQQHTSDTITQIQDKDKLQYTILQPPSTGYVRYQTVQRIQPLGQQTNEQQHTQEQQIIQGQYQLHQQTPDHQTYQHLFQAQYEIHGHNTNNETHGKHQPLQQQLQQQQIMQQQPFPQHYIQHNEAKPQYIYQNANAQLQLDVPVIQVSEVQAQAYAIKSDQRQQSKTENIEDKTKSRKRNRETGSQTEATKTNSPTQKSDPCRSYNSKHMNKLNFFECNLCSKDFKRKSDLYYHYKDVHYCLRKYCMFCLDEFESDRALKLHTTRIHKDKKHLDLVPYRARIAFWKNYTSNIDITPNKTTKYSYSYIKPGTSHTQAIMTNQNKQTESTNIKQLLETAKTKFTFAHEKCHWCLNAISMTQNPPTVDEEEQNIKYKLSQALEYASSCQAIIVLQDTVIDQLQEKIQALAPNNNPTA